MRGRFNRNTFLFSVLTHPFFIGGLIWAGIYFAFKPNVEKYQVKHIEDFDGRLSDNFFYDLDGDKLSERIRIDSKDTVQTKVLVYKDMRIVDQYNLHYRVTEGDYLAVFDYDRDDLMELAIFTQNEDSIFLNILNPFLEDPMIRADRFIDLEGENEFSVKNTVLIPIDAWGEGKKDFYFAINTGHTKRPRNLYRYNIDLDSLVKSPKSGTPVGLYGWIDFDGDSVNEIYITGRATGNFPSEYPYSDQFSWLMVYNRDLDFLFPPIKIGQYPSQLWAQPINSKDSTFLAVFYEYMGTGQDTSALFLINKEGSVVRERKLTNSEYHENSMSVVFSEPGGDIFLLNSQSGRIRIFNHRLERSDELWIPGNSKNPIILSMDLNSDNVRDLFLFSGDHKLVVTSSDFREFTVYPYPYGQINPVISRIYRKDQQNLLYLQFKDYGQIIKIQQNPLYYLEVPLLILAWVGISFLIFGMYQIQRYRTNRTREQEKRIITLQMRAIKNQLDPHFTFNIINAMGGLYLSDINKEISYEIFVKYAKLLRQTLVSSQQISISLKEELEMVGSYLDIENLRKDYGFEYKLDIDNTVDMETKIPRMLIFTFVENAIKHGIRSNDNQESFIHININKEKKGMKITIENSGPGLNTYAGKSNSTGMGLNILNEIAELYEKLEGRIISIKMKNLIDDAGKIRGVQGEVFLSS
jgi:hypothetical protein